QQEGDDRHGPQWGHAGVEIGQEFAAGLLRAEFPDSPILVIPFLAHTRRRVAIISQSRRTTRDERELVALVIEERDMSRLVVHRLVTNLKERPRGWQSPRQLTGDRVTFAGGKSIPDRPSRQLRVNLLGRRFDPQRHHLPKNRRSTSDIRSTDWFAA